MDIIANLEELEAQGDLMITKGQEIKKFVAGQRKKLGDVSTSPNTRKGLTAAQAAVLQNKIQQKFNRKLQS